MANRVFQSVIYQMKDAINRVVGVVDETGAVISCSELNLIGEVREGYMAERLTAGDRFVRDGYTYQPVSYTHLDVYKRQSWLPPASATRTLT